MTLRAVEELPGVLLHKEFHITPENYEALENRFNVFLMSGLDDLKYMYASDKEKVTVLLSPPTVPLGGYDLKSLPNLKYIVSNSTTDTHIAPEYREQYEIITLAGHPILQGITSTAEHTLGLIMALHRRIPATMRDVQRGKWNRFDWGAPRMLSEMTLGIVGPGRVGEHLEHISAPMYKKIYLYDPDTPRVTLYKCDIIAITASVREADSQPIISRDILSELKPSTLLINTARAELLDHNCLLEMLEQGLIRGAALDVFPHEGTLDKGKMNISGRLIDYSRAHDNLIITPHIAGSTEDAWAMTQDAVIDLLLERLETEK